MEFGEILNQAIAVLRPDSVADIFIYAIFFLSLFTLVPLPDGNDQAQYLIFGVIFLSILDLLRQADPGAFPLPGAENDGFLTFIIHVGMFVFPFLIAGLARNNTKQKTGATIPLALLTGLIALMYAVISFATPDTIYSAL